MRSVYGFPPQNRKTYRLRSSKLPAEAIKCVRPRAQKIFCLHHRPIVMASVWRWRWSAPTEDHGSQTTLI